MSDLTADAWEIVEQAILALSEPIGGKPYWWQPYSDEQLTPAQANALNRAIAVVRDATPPSGWTEFEERNLAHETGGRR